MNDILRMGLRELTVNCHSKPSTHMQSHAPTVDQFLEALPADRREALSAIRALIQQTAPGLQETMRYKMPTYEEPDGRVIYAFNAQKNYLALYVGEVPQHLLPTLKGCNLGKGCIRFTKLPPERLAALQNVLVETRNTPC